MPQTKLLLVTANYSVYTDSNGSLYVSKGSSDEPIKDTGSDPLVVDLVEECLRLRGILNTDAESVVRAVMCDGVSTKVKLRAAEILLKHGHKTT